MWGKIKKYIDVDIVISKIGYNIKLNQHWYNKKYIFKKNVTIKKNKIIFSHTWLLFW